MEDKVLKWFAVGKVGMSSAAMANHLCGKSCDGSYPVDSDDLNRCLLFLEAVPEARKVLSCMKNVNKVWTELVVRWNEIEKLFYSECVGLDRSGRIRVPKTDLLIWEIIDHAYNLRRDENEDVDCTGIAQEG